MYEFGYYLQSSGIEICRSTNDKIFNAQWQLFASLKIRLHACFIENDHRTITMLINAVPGKTCL